MTKEQKDAFKAVEKINEELFAKYDELNTSDNYKDWLAIMPILSVTFAGGYLFINLTIPSNDVCKLHEFSIYNSENNDRIYIEEKDTYETFYIFIKRKFDEIKEVINEVKL